MFRLFCYLPPFTQFNDPGVPSALWRLSLSFGGKEAISIYRRSGGIRTANRASEEDNLSTPLFDLGLCSGMNAEKDHVAITYEEIAGVFAGVLSQLNLQIINC